MVQYVYKNKKTGKIVKSFAKMDEKVWMLIWPAKNGMIKREKITEKI
jgi:hypothetical protein